MGQDGSGGPRALHVLAAGGVLERETAEGTRIAVLRRTRYRDRDGTQGDWVLPKGKCEPGESLAEAALREVREETGWSARALGPCFPCTYQVDAVPKIVVFFKMACLEEVGAPDADEVERVVWMTPSGALARLTYDSERDVLRSLYRDLPTGLADGGD